MNREALLESILQRFFAPHGWTVWVAAELEFYLTGIQSDQLPPLWQRLCDRAAARHIAIEKIEAERGEGQYEIALSPQPHPLAICAGLEAIREMLGEMAKNEGLNASFAAKPYADRPASGLHFHLHLIDAEGHNPYYKDDDTTSEPLIHSLGGLLALMRETMLAFAPTSASYARFTPRGTTPTTISWGANNRTVAVRLPDTGTHTKRIEHRVPGADADPYFAMAAMLAGIGFGLEEKLVSKLPQIYGDATLDQYNLEKLPASLEQARTQLENATILPRVCPDLARLLRAMQQTS